MGVRKVTVLMDGHQVIVPKRVGSWEALRRALGVAEGYTVGAIGMVSDGMGGEEEGIVILGENDLDRPGKNPRCWEFDDGEKYVSVPIEQAGKTTAYDVPDLPFNEDGDMPWSDHSDGPWTETDSDWWKKGA